ncbi:NTP transferase domain-containing protein [Deinococcus altitudinis]|uniref:nucleotidyltransferase family protein n=1 Tax=Deinococcus altitudinis TaxID=468914 RepID=UPI003891A6FA
MTAPETRSGQTGSGPAAAGPPASGPVVGVILAAGLSRRLGRPKQLVPLTARGEKAGRALIWHTTRAMLEAAPSGGVLVVTPPGDLGERVRAALDGLDVRFTENLRPELGISESFRAGIAALDTDTGAASFALGDMPLVSAAMQRAVIDAYEATNAPLVLARFGPGRDEDWVRAPPHLFRADLFAGFEQQGDHGPRHLIRQYAAQTVWVDLPAEALGDLDTPEDVQAMQTRFAQRERPEGNQSLGPESGGHSEAEQMSGVPEEEERGMV